MRNMFERWEKCLIIDSSHQKQRVTYSIWDSLRNEDSNLSSTSTGFANNTNVIHNLIPHPNGVKLWAIKASAIYTHPYTHEGESVTYTWILVFTSSPWWKLQGTDIETLKWCIGIAQTFPPTSPFPRFPNHSLYFAIPSGANDDSLLF